MNTFVIAMNYAVIPQKFDVHLGYTLSLANNVQPLIFANGTGPTSGGFPSLIAGVNNPGQFPNVNTSFQRVDLTAKIRCRQGFRHQPWLEG